MFEILSNLVLAGTAPGDIATQAFMSVSLHPGRENHLPDSQTFSISHFGKKGLLWYTSSSQH